MISASDAWQILTSPNVASISSLIALILAFVAIGFAWLHTKNLKQTLSKADISIDHLKLVVTKADSSI